MPPDDCRRRELVAVILRAALMVLRAIDRYFDSGVFKHKT
jgi:hypothetical protein